MDSLLKKLPSFCQRYRIVFKINDLLLFEFRRLKGIFAFEYPNIDVVDEKIIIFQPFARYWNVHFGQIACSVQARHAALVQQYTSMVIFILTATFYIQIYRLEHQLLRHPFICATKLSHKYLYQLNLKNVVLIFDDQPVAIKAFPSVFQLRVTKPKT